MLQRDEYETLYMRNIRAIQFAANRSKPRDVDRDEWTSEMYLHIWRKIHTYDPAKGRFTTWLMAVAMSLRGTHIKKMQYKCRSATVFPIHSANGSSQLAIDTPDHRAETAGDIDRRVDIGDAVSKMIKSDRDIVETIMNGSKDGEFARERKLSRQRVNLLRERALKRLHRKLWRTDYSVRKEGK